MKYRRLNQYIKNIEPQTIIVDVFDTLLLRRWQPEQWRFYVLAKLFEKEFKKANLNASAYYLYKQRTYFSKVIRLQNHLDGYDNEATHKTIINTIILDCERRQHKSLNTKSRSSLYKKLLSIEINYEKDQLILNKKLYKLLINQKQSNKKIYFISDMYFEQNDITKLLSSFKIKFISGGVSSADKLLGKSSGRSFVVLANKYPSIKLNLSLYIGDNYKADVLRPKQFGLQSVWLYLPLHRLKLLFGKAVYKVALTSLSLKEKYIQNKLQKNQLSKLFSRKSMNTKNEATYLGWIFGPALVYYLHRLNTQSQTAHKKIIFVTSESLTLENLYKQLGFGKTRKLPYLNRTVLVKSYAHLLSKKGLQLTEIVPLVKKILRRKDTTNALLTLGIISKSNKHHHLLGKSILSKKSLNKIDISEAQEDWSNQYLSVVKSWKSLGLNKQPNIMLADVGWNDTVQILLSEILIDKTISITKMSGLYLGRTGVNIFDPQIVTSSQGVVFNSLKGRKEKYLYQPEVWESFLNQDNIKTETQSDIMIGLSQAIEYFNKSQLTAEDFWRLNRQTIFRTFKKPTRRMIEVMSSLQFDYGTAEEPICPLVNISSTKLQTYKWLLFDRKKFKSFYFHQGWKWGAATYYRFRTPYRLWRFITKKPSY